MLFQLRASSDQLPESCPRPPGGCGEAAVARERERPPKLARKLFPSSGSSSVCEEEAGQHTAPIARLESLDELETSQVGAALCATVH